VKYFPLLLLFCQMSKSNMKLSDGNCRFLAWQLLGIRNREADRLINQASTLAFANCIELYNVLQYYCTPCITLMYSSGTWSGTGQSGDLTAVVSPGCQDDAVPGSIYWHWHWQRIFVVINCVKCPCNILNVKCHYNLCFHNNNNNTASHDLSLYLTFQL